MKTCEQCGKPMQDILEYVEHILHECNGQTTEYSTDGYPAQTQGYECVREQM
ncbi:hypothetical protein YWY31_43440 [Paenibacillus illinoisensis]|uniref:Uncharacterized protein n=1 Tax=Paenibacillus illinoisensis TaxID=59845 RepID=A0A2W0C9E6_9BACL|nr:hypothetical protein [Paenibacillus illinoisensis]MBM6383588.1 hypothetical protein [Paenibacillus sp.]MCM3206700.1 hypothetical protein [Paenibacillus illinoisensis]PYY29240.1 hypothetical protein PIL02S_02189 [Paenibacillus illinoisensis]